MPVTTNFYQSHLAELHQRLVGHVEVQSHLALRERSMLSSI
jgi:hypothetical protein